MSVVRHKRPDQVPIPPKWGFYCMRCESTSISWDRHLWMNVCTVCGFSFPAPNCKHCNSSDIKPHQLEHGRWKCVTCGKTFINPKGNGPRLSTVSHVELPLTNVVQLLLPKFGLKKRSPSEPEFPTRRSKRIRTSANVCQYKEDNNSEVEFSEEGSSSEENRSPNQREFRRLRCPTPPDPKSTVHSFCQSNESSERSESQRVISKSFVETTSNRGNFSIQTTGTMQIRNEDPLDRTYRRVLNSIAKQFVNSTESTTFVRNQTLSALSHLVTHLTQQQQHQQQQQQLQKPTHQIFTKTFCNTNVISLESQTSLPTDANMTMSMSMSVNSTKGTDTNLSLVSTVSSSNTLIVNHEMIPSLLALLKLNLPFSDNKSQTLTYDVEVVLWVMKALSQLAKDIEIVDRMIRDDAIHVILQVLQYNLKEQRTDDDVIVCSLFTLSALVNCVLQRKHRLTNIQCSQIVSTTVDVMLQFPLNSSLQLFGCRILFNFCSDPKYRQFVCLTTSNNNNSNNNNNNNESVNNMLDTILNNQTIREKLSHHNNILKALLKLILKDHSSLDHIKQQSSSSGGEQCEIPMRNDLKSVNSQNSSSLSSKEPSNGTNWNEKDKSSTHFKHLPVFTSSFKPPQNSTTMNEENIHKSGACFLSLPQMTEIGTLIESKLVAFACLNRILALTSTLPSESLQIDHIKLSPLHLIEIVMGFIHRHFVEKTSDSLYLDSSSPMTNTIRLGEVSSFELMSMLAETIECLGRLVKFTDTLSTHFHGSHVTNMNIDLRKQILTLLLSVLDVYIHEKVIVCSVCNALLTVLPTRSPSFYTVPTNILSNSPSYPFTSTNPSDVMPMQIEVPCGSFSSLSRSLSTEIELLRSFAIECGFHLKLQYAMYLHQLSWEVVVHCSEVLNSRFCLRMSSSEYNKRPYEMYRLNTTPSNETIERQDQLQKWAREENVQHDVNNSMTNTSSLEGVISKHRVLSSQYPHSQQQQQQQQQQYQHQPPQHPQHHPQMYPHQA